MKKTLLLFAALCAIQLAAHGQTTTAEQRVVHNHYTTYYNPTKREPDSVVWDLTPAMINCASLHGKRNFQRDPSIPGSPSKSDYNAAWSRGHLFNFEEAGCNATDIVECCYMTNMLPQNQSFNAGDWKTVEKYEQGLAKGGATLHIIAGGIGSQGRNVGGVNIPQQMWKAIYYNGTWTYWIMDNTSTSIKHDYKFWQKSKAFFDQETGCTF